jgi:transcriptional regulator with XRE-family HTH domain
MSDKIDNALSTSLLTPMDRAMNLKRQLQHYLDLKDITAAELSRKSGVSRQVLSLWLGGVEPKKLSQVKKVADALGTTVDHLVFGSGTDIESRKITELDALLGDGWVSGLFEVRFRRVKK